MVLSKVPRSCVPRKGKLSSISISTIHILSDEAQDFIADDLHFAEILDTAREARIGMLVAAHHMQITNDHVRQSLYTNTALKFTAKSMADIHNLCRAMGNVETDFITNLNDYEFAFFGPNMRTAMKVKFLPV